METILTREYEDIRVQVPWGFIVGRWYGNKRIRPIVALHGWLDNLGTFERLIPLMPSHIGVLSIDLPGHGLSSKFPKGIVYHAVDYVFVILRIMKEYSWKKVSLMAHSMSSIVSFIFAALYPDRVDMLIAFDVINPLDYHPEIQIDRLHRNIEKYLIEDERMSIQHFEEPPSYTYEQLKELLYIGSGNSVDVENCKFILDRNIAKSEKYPAKYYFSRDGRVKCYEAFAASTSLSAEMAKRISSLPYLVVKGSESMHINETSKEVISILSKNNPHFEFHEITGTHHVHLNNPEAVSVVVNNFINRHRPPMPANWSLESSSDPLPSTSSSSSGTQRKRHGRSKL